MLDICIIKERLSRSLRSCLSSTSLLYFATVQRPDQFEPLINFTRILPYLNSGIYKLPYREDLIVANASS